MSWWKPGQVLGSDDILGRMQTLEGDINNIGAHCTVELNQFKDVVNRCTAYEDHVQKLQAELTQAATVIGKHLKTLDDDLARMASTFRAEIDELAHKVASFENDYVPGVIKAVRNTNRKKKR